MDDLSLKDKPLNGNRKHSSSSFDKELQDDSNPTWQRVRHFLHQEVLREYPIVMQVQRLRNPILDVYFAVASSLGEELFFTAFIPFSAWELSPRLCLHYATLLALGIVFGNYLKNIFLLPRPAPPCWVRYKTDDHGLPSTHTISSFMLSMYIFLFLYRDGTEWAIQNVISTPFAFGFAVLWFCSISFSRLYNGLHTPIDVGVGFAIGATLLYIFYNYLRYFIDCAVQNTALYVPLLEIAIGATIVYFHPRPPVPSSVLPESTLVMGVATGAYVAQWIVLAFDIPRSFIIENPIIQTYGSPAIQELFAGGFALGFVRFFLGILILGLTRLLCKKMFLFLTNLAFDLAGVRSAERTSAVELTVKFLTYLSLGIAVGVPAQYTFKYLGISTAIDESLVASYCIVPT